MWPLLIVLLAISLALARRWLGHWEEALTVGLGLLQVILLLTINMAWRVGGWSHWGLALSVLLLAGAGALLFGPRGGALTAVPADRRIYFLSALCVLIAWLGQGLVHDDDYALHGALEGQLMRGDFPLRSPWFPEVVVNYHYGRDLLVVIWAKLTGLSLFTAQFASTLLCQALLPLVTYWALYRWSEERKSSFWGSFFMTVGVRVGGRAGFVDTYQNNNSLAQLYLVLVLYFFCSAWRYRRWSDVGWFSLVLGGYAVVYETQFGLACLACVTAFALGLRWSPAPAKLLLQGGVVVAVALGLACTQGGPLTEVAQRLASHQDTQGGRAQAIASQQVQMKFPKEQMWQIRSALDSPASVEAVSDRAWIYRANQIDPDPNSGYRPFWDWSILGLHHFPLFLSPIVLWAAFRRRDVASIWLIAFGIAGFMVPAVVSFGPYFESEWFRWEYAAGLPLAGALGVWVSPVLERALQGSWWRRLAAGGGLLFCSSNAWSIAFSLLQMISARWSQGLPIYAGAHDLVMSQPQYFCTDDDWRAMHHLRKISERDDRVLINSPEELWPNLNFSATMACITGLYPVGNRKTLESDVGRQWPFRIRADVRAFWNSGDLRLLEMRPVEWIYWRGDEAFYPAVSPGKVAGVAWKQVGQRRLGRVLRPWTKWDLERAAEPLALQVQMQTPASLRSASCYAVDLQLTNHSDRTLPQGRLLLKVGEDSQDWLLYPVSAGLAAGQTWSSRVPLAVPHEEGQVEVHFAWVDTQGVHPITKTQSLRLDFSYRLAKMELLSVTTASPARAGQWVQLTSRWRAPQLAYEPNLWLRASLAAVLSSTEAPQPLSALMSGTGPGLAATVPHTSQQRVRLRSTSAPEEWELTAYTRLPDAPGRYRIDWFLSPSYACGVRQRGLILEVLP